MSNIPASNPPENSATETSTDGSGDSSAESDCRPPHAADHPTTSVTIDLVWDESVEPWKSKLGLTDDRIVDAACAAAVHLGFTCGQLGVRVTDDATIHIINREHLNHDYPTDVISFPYSDDAPHLEGELVVSIETANENALQYETETVSELLLYVIHGVLHIGGLDDQSDEQRDVMRAAERTVMGVLGLNGISSGAPQA
ncbi:rRNA maturation RNase YbeY [Roseiconus lacunae]|uniref:rRNA maturation RNase YbeY n=1 Tax=Roseiconus lacunae TaxID=2605694 RepID=UPI001E5F53BE|nr:rRNA maturation RNase YbeY [Roseiconus lacunae]MCD0459627.1 rRNA maturation RNase YbeY [Roseiconus lacunae]